MLEHVIPRLSEAGHNSVGYVDSLVGTHELSFRFETHKMSLDDWYFKQKNGTFDVLITGLRMKVQSVYKFFELRKKCLDHSGRNFYQLGEDVSAICNLILMCPPFPNPLLDYVFEEVPFSFFYSVYFFSSPGGFVAYVHVIFMNI